MPQRFPTWCCPVGYYFKCKFFIRFIAYFESDKYMVTASSKEINAMFIFSSSNCVFNWIQNRSITKTLCAGSFDF
jgi:lipocalin